VNTCTGNAMCDLSEQGEASVCEIAAAL
jgi:hypothetical protein